MLKNSIQGHTEAFKRMRADRMEYYTKYPFVGQPEAKKLHEALKKVCNIVQVSICGCITNVVCYKQDADKINSLMCKMFEIAPRQKEDDLTGLVNVTVIIR